MFSSRRKSQIQIDRGSTWETCDRMQSNEGAQGLFHSSRFSANNALKVYSVVKKEVLQESQKT